MSIIHVSATSALLFPRRLSKLRRSFYFIYFILFISFYVFYFILNWPFMKQVRDHVRAMLYSGREDRAGSHFVDAQADVDTLVEHFKATIGRTYRAATTRNANAHVTIGPHRARRPWIEVRDVMQRRGQEAPHVFIRRHVRDLTPFFAWSP